MKCLCLAIFTFIICLTGFSQDSIFTHLATENLKLFSPQSNSFTGEGWEYIKNKVEGSQNILVGEDHFSNEIPFFIKAVSDLTKFDNFYIEVDPYTTKLLGNSFKLPIEERKAFQKKYKNILSFYSLQPEYDMLEHIMNSGVNLLGSDQIVMYDDQLIFEDVIKRTKNKQAIPIYKNIIEQSKKLLDDFYNNSHNPMSMYFMTPEFLEQLNKLEQLDLSEEEDHIINDMRLSVSIYKEQNHSKRVKLLLNQLMKDYPKWKNSKNLFKYGANHLARGESFLTVFDIGNMVANITKSNFEESFHIMIVGESGFLGSIFEMFPPTEIDIENGFYLSYLKPLFNITEGNQWHLFNMEPIRKAVEKNHLKIDNVNLLRVVKGYDALIIIPKVTPAKF